MLSMSVRDELEKLSLLQEIDLKIDRAKNLSRQAPSAFADLERDIAKETAALTELQNQKTEFEKQKRTVETDLAMDGDRIKNIESRLSQVSNNKEYHAAAKEAEKAKKLNSDRQKMIADLAEKSVALDAKVTEVQGRIDTLTTQLNTKKSEVGQKINEAEQEIASYAGDRDNMASAVSKPLMSRYNRIRSRYSDALVVVNSGHCTSCNVSLPPQLYIQVQKAIDVIACPSCQRLLFYKIQ